MILKVELCVWISVYHLRGNGLIRIMIIQGYWTNSNDDCQACIYMSNDLSVQEKFIYSRIIIIRKNNFMSCAHISGSSIL